MNDLIRALGALILVLALSFGLVIAIGSPFWAYRYLSAPERRAPDLRRRWRQETAKGELLAAGVLVVGGALAAWMLVPMDVRTMARIEVGAAIILALAAPIVTLRGMISRETFGFVAVRQWLVKASKLEFVAVYAGIWGALVLLPRDFWAYGILMLLQIVSAFLILIESVRPALGSGFLGQRAFQEEYNQYLARHGRDSETGRQMQRHMHGGQLDADAAESAGGNETR